MTRLLMLIVVVCGGAAIATAMATVVAIPWIAPGFPGLVSPAGGIWLAGVFAMFAAGAYLIVDIIEDRRR